MSADNPNENATANTEKNTEMLADLRARADAAEARVAELEAIHSLWMGQENYAGTPAFKVYERMLNAEAERDRLRAGITALVDDWSVVLGPGSTIRYGSQMWKELRALLCPPTADEGNDR